MLFSGDVQTNLDPFGELDETDLQVALSACTAIQVANGTGPGPGLAEGHTGTSIALKTPVAANGAHFSQGQRQVRFLDWPVPSAVGRKSCFATKRQPPLIKKQTNTSSAFFDLNSPTRQSSQSRIAYGPS